MAIRSRCSKNSRGAPEPFISRNTKRKPSRATITKKYFSSVKPVPAPNGTSSRWADRTATVLMCRVMLWKDFIASVNDRDEVVSKTKPAPRMKTNGSKTRGRPANTPHSALVAPKSNEGGLRIPHSDRLSRRQFILAGGAAAAGFTIVPRHVLGG